MAGAFDDKDTSVQASVTRGDIVEEITFRRNRHLPDPGLVIIVTRRLTVNGEQRLVSKRVPRAAVEAGWPGTARTLKAHLGIIIDAATE
jgi:hypothetical protein